MNRNGVNFCKLRAQWPGRNLDAHSNFARRKYSSIFQVRVPRNGVLGGRRHGGRAALSILPIAPAPQRLFGDFLAVQKVTRRRGCEIPPA